MTKEISDDFSSMSAQDVANAFVRQYYLILHLSPEDTHKFYKDSSVMARSGSDSTMTIVSTMKGINDEIMSFDYKECTSKIDIVHAQSSLNEAVIVGVTGHLTRKDNVTKTFTQTFLLAPQATGGYYVMNDILFYVDVKETASSPALPVDEVPENAPTTPLAQDPEPTHVPEEIEKVSEEIPKPSDQSDNKSVVAKSEPTAKPSDQSDNKSVVAKSEPTAKPSDQSDNKSVVAKSEPTAKPSSSKNNVAPVPKPVATSQTDPLKKSYASMLAKEREATSPAPVVVRVNPGQQSSSGAPSLSKPASPRTKVSVPTSNGAQGSINSPPDAKSIHIRGLPYEITDEELITRFKKFGAVKERSIRIKRFEDGFCYAFLEFETEKSAHTAVEAEIEVFRGKEAQIQYKKSSNQNHPVGNNRGRSPSARGGYYNGRENFGDGQRGGRYESGRPARGSPTRGSSKGRYDNYQARGSSAGRNGDSYQRQGYQNGGGGEKRVFRRGGGN